jgi:pyruvate/2-oxoacid:ferredoxin oxidoreductase alpha subunit
MFRPFPEQALVEALSGARRVAVLDRDISLGFGGVLWGELRGCLPREVLTQGYVLGLGGGDIRPEHLSGILDDILARDEAAAPVIQEVA